VNKDQKFGKAFIECSRERLMDSLLPKIIHCLSLLPEEEIWKRSNENVNSVGNIVLHLCGNVHQWITSGIGGEKDSRRRGDEFRKGISMSKSELKRKLEITLKEADEVLEKFDTGQLKEIKKIQGFEETCLEAIYHVVEHFSYHVGQVVHVTKTILDKDLEFTYLTPEGYKPDSGPDRYI
jgi:uncharacterized damage-inducible protein DinB